MDMGEELVFVVLYCSRSKLTNKSTCSNDCNDADTSILETRAISLWTAKRFFSGDTTVITS